MTKKDYESLAAAIRESEATNEAKLPVIREIASRLASENPRFNEARFIAACTKK